MLENYLATLEDGEANLAATDTLIDVLSKSLDPRAQQLLHHKQFLSKNPTGSWAAMAGPTISALAG